MRNESIFHIYTLYSFTKRTDVLEKKKKDKYTRKNLYHHKTTYILENISKVLENTYNIVKNDVLEKINVLEKLHKTNILRKI